MQECTGDRTKDFTLALMDFTLWDENENNNMHENKNENVDHNDNDNMNGRYSLNSSENKKSGSTIQIDLSNDKKYYVWPDFILDLLNRPVEWSAWRKRVERGINFEAKKSRGSGNGNGGGGGLLSVLSVDNVNDKIEMDNRSSSATTTTTTPAAAAAAAVVVPVVMTRRIAYFEALKRDRMIEINAFEIEGKGQVVKESEVK